MRHRLVLAGGGHAHLYTLSRLAELTARGALVTLVTPDRYHYYSGMAPAMLAGTCRPQDIRFDVACLAERGGGSCVIGTAHRIDTVNRSLILQDGTGIPYDTLSCNVGSSVVLPSPTQANVIPAKPIDGLLAARNRVRELLAEAVEPSLLVVGGGPAGVELAGALWRLARDAGRPARVTLVTGGTLLAGMPPKAQKTARHSLASRGIAIHEQTRVTRFGDNSALLPTGQELPFQMALLATGVTPPAIFRDSGLPVADDGSLLVNDRLQAVTHPELLGGGDCITPPDGRLTRVGVYAVRQGPVLFANLLARINGTSLSPFSPQKRFLQILNLGDGSGLMIRGSWVLAGRIAYLLKQIIDYRYMHHYQRCGERNAPS